MSSQFTLILTIVLSSHKAKAACCCMGSTCTPSADCYARSGSCVTGSVSCSSSYCGGKDGEIGSVGSCNTPCGDPDGCTCPSNCAVSQVSYQKTCGKNQDECNQGDFKCSGFSTIKTNS